MFSLRPTVPDDAPILCSIQKEAFYPLYERYRDQGNPYLRDERDILLRLDNPSFRYYTIYAQGRIVGGILYRIQGSTPFCPALPLHEYYLQRIYIAPDMQGQHIARNAILLCEKQFPDARRFHVDFPEDLHKNRRCYEGAGFLDTGFRLAVEPTLTLAAYVKDIKGGTNP